MTDEAAPTKRGRGRPEGSTTGVTPLRTAKIGATWDRGQELDLELARLNGTAKQRRNRQTGEMEDVANMTAYVEAALLEHNARTERLITKRKAEQAG